jgi:hypothetical protein
MEIYKHTQVGTLVLAGLGGAIALTAWILKTTPGRPVIAEVVLAILVGCIILFPSLTVRVTTDTVRVWFGPGLIRRNFPVHGVHHAHLVRNPWYYGWGIRLTPHGWMFNVSGLDAVELELAGGRRFRIGTDQPRELMAAIQQASGRSS